MSAGYFSQVRMFHRLISLFLHISMVGAGWLVGTAALVRPIEVSETIPSREVILSLDTIDARNATLVLALDPICEFCDASVDFYRPLLMAAQQASIRTNAIFNVSPSLSAQYLKEKKLHFDTVSKVNFRDYEIKGTPTLLVVDARGNVVAKWEGLLDANDKRQLTSLLRITEGYLTAEESDSEQLLEQSSSPSADSRDLVADLASGAAVLIDTNSRESFAIRHADGAINVPYDDLPIVASAELNPSRKVYLYCEYDRFCEGSLRDAYAKRYCDLARSILLESGLSDIRLVNKAQYDALPRSNGGVGHGAEGISWVASDTSL